MSIFESLVSSQLQSFITRSTPPSAETMLGLQIGSGMVMEGRVNSMARISQNLQPAYDEVKAVEAQILQLHVDHGKLSSPTQNQIDAYKASIILLETRISRIYEQQIQPWLPLQKTISAEKA